MPPAGYPAFLQYLQSGRVRQNPILLDTCLKFGVWAAAFAPSSWSDPELGSFCAEETECVGHYSFEAKR